MVENQDQINEVISIDKEQKLIDQFDCLLLNLSPIQGHFYLSENSPLIRSRFLKENSPFQQLLQPWSAQPVFPYQVLQIQSKPESLEKIHRIRRS